LASSEASPRRPIGIWARNDDAIWSRSSEAIPMSRPRIGVFVSPGLSVFTRMRRGRSSVARLRPNERMAALHALYTDVIGAPRDCAGADETRMIEPLSFMCGSAF